MDSEFWGPGFTTDDSVWLVVSADVFDFMGEVVGFVHVLGVGECFLSNGCGVESPLTHGTVVVKAFVELLSGTSMEDVTMK